MADPLDSLETSLSKDVGGVPVWVIGGGVGVLIGVGYWLYQRNNGGPSVNVYDPSAETPAEDADPTNSDWGLPDGPAGDWLADNPGSTAFPVGGMALPSPITNGQWARQVIDGLLAKADDPTLVVNAITKYLAGKGLTVAEKGVVNRAITLFGSPPEGALQILDVSPATTPMPTGKRGYGWYHVVAGDSPTSIAQRYNISVGTFHVWNGVGSLKAGRWVKVRAGSNPLFGYNGV